MGSQEGAPDESPRAIVKIKKPFWMAEAEITNAEFHRFDPTHDSRFIDQQWKDHIYEGYPANEPQMPATRVSWNRAMAYCKWLSTGTGKQYRLPSEAEWDYACRAGTTTARWWGEEAGENRANFPGSGSEWSGKQTSPVGSFEANPFGLYDMLGNVWEWVGDNWHDNYKDAPIDGSAWLLSGGGGRVIRGGSWFHRTRWARSASRDWSPPDYRNNSLGFRLTQDLK